MKRCAIYTRVSTTMQAEKEYNSCEAQRDKILSYIRSQENLQVYREYMDPGFSGASLERPALNELLHDISSGNVNVVLTYKIDRLTRSSKDFYQLIDFFERHGVSFISVTEHFDTTSPAGRLLRNIMLTFAQFEREMTSSRIKDKLQQQAEKGIWNGRAVPFGYKTSEGKLVPEINETKTVNKIFESAAATGSVVATLKWMKQNGLTLSRTAKSISQSGLYHLLSNPVYIGQIRWLKNVYKGEHAAILNEDLFHRVQAVIGVRIKKRRFFREALLAGLIKCADCGSGMAPYHTKRGDKRYFYYKCHKVVRNGPEACSIKAVPAEPMENHVLSELARLVQDKPYLETLAYRSIHESPRYAGIEISQISYRTLAENVQNTLKRLYEGTQTGSAYDRRQTILRTIQSIRLSKDRLDVAVVLEDGSNTVGSGLAGKMAARIRGVEVKPTPRAYNTEFESKNGGAHRPTLTRPQDPCTSHLFVISLVVLSVKCHPGR